MISAFSDKEKQMTFLGIKFMCILDLFLAVFANSCHGNGGYVSASLIKASTAQEINEQNMILLQWGI